MNRTSAWKWILAACFLLIWTASAQAAPMAELTASYDAIFLIDAEPIDPVPANIYCCTHTGSCVSTSARKCTTATGQGGYGGTVHDTLLECRQAGCTS